MMLFWKPQHRAKQLSQLLTSHKLSKAGLAKSQHDTDIGKPIDITELYVFKQGVLWRVFDYII